MAAKTAPVAKEALLCLHKRISEGREGQKPGEEAVVLRSLIKVVAGAPDLRLSSLYFSIVTGERQEHAR